MPYTRPTVPANGGKEAPRYERRREQPSEQAAGVRTVRHGVGTKTLDDQMREAHQMRKEQVKALERIAAALEEQNKTLKMLTSILNPHDNAEYR
jgi:hypothetical protein